jgi:hypothetical protein
MAQITIYLDDEHDSRLRAAAKAEGIPASRWIARLIEEKTRSDWPESVRAMAGAWLDYPEAEALRAELAQDARRESF